MPHQSYIHIQNYFKRINPTTLTVEWKLHALLSSSTRTFITHSVLLHPKTHPTKKKNNSKVAIALDNILISQSMPAYYIDETFKRLQKGIEIMKVMKVAPTDKLVEFAKKEANIKEFHQDQPVSELLRSEMVKVHRDFERYMQEMYFDEIKSLLKEFIDEHHPREEKRKSLEHNLIWWKILYDSSEEEWSCTDDYIDENYHCFIDKDAITSWLREWDQVSTRFYFVGHKYNDRNFFVIDIFDEKMLNVVVLDPKVAPPKEGEIVIGTLIPYGDGVYSPITDFYCFDYEAREAMGGTFRFYYDKYLKANSLSASFVHVLSIMLQIERRIHQKILRVK